jgi:hypothetical protein
MRLSVALTTWLGYSALLLAGSPQPVHADTYSFAASMHKDGGGNACFGWGDSAEGSVGLFPDTSSSCSSQRAIMPLYWRNFYFPWTVRTVSVRGKRLDSNAQISCTLYAVGGDGFVASQVTKSFTTTGAYTLLDFSITNVSSTSSSFLSCSMSGSSWLMNVTYNP